MRVRDGRWTLQVPGEPDYRIGADAHDPDLRADPAVLRRPNDPQRAAVPSV